MMAYQMSPVTPPGHTHTIGWMNASDAVWGEVPDVPVSELPDGWYLVSPGGYFWGPRPSLLDLDHEVFTGAGPGGPTLEASEEDWFVQVRLGRFADSAFRPIRGSRPVITKEATRG